MKVKTSIGGGPSKRELFFVSFSIVPLLVIMVFLFLGRVFDKLKLLKSLLRRGFLGPRIGSPHPVVLKEVLPVFKTSDISTEDEASSISGPVIIPSLLEDKQGVHSTATFVLPSSQVCESSNRTVVTEPNPINSSVS
jgi:hypothetical protein